MANIVNWAYFFHSECKVCDLCSIEWLRDEVWDCAKLRWMAESRQSRCDYLSEVDCGYIPVNLSSSCSMQQHSNSSIFTLFMYKMWMKVLICKSRYLEDEQSPWVQSIWICYICFTLCINYMYLKLLRWFADIKAPNSQNVSFEMVEL